MTKSQSSYRRSLSFAALALTVSFACSVMAPGSATAMMAAGLKGLEPMGQDELASYHGGFILPNGMNINIGIETDIAINGNLVSKTWVGTDPVGPQSAVGPAISTHHAGNNQITQVITLTNAGNPNTNSPQGSLALSPLQGGALLPDHSVLISNSLNNALISQSRTITIDVANYSALNLQGIAGLAALRSMMLGSLQNRLR